MAMEGGMGLRACHRSRMKLVRDHVVILRRLLGQRFARCTGSKPKQTTELFVPVLPRSILCRRGDTARAGESPPRTGREGQRLAQAASALEHAIERTRARIRVQRPATLARCF